MATGWQLYRLSPGMWTLLVLAWWMLVAVVNRIPLLGPLASTIVLPAFMMSFMVMCEEVRHGRPLRPNLLFAGFHTRVGPLLALGVLYLLSVVLILGLSSLADGGLLLRWVLWAEVPPDAALRDGTVSGALLLASVLGTPVFAAFWFAPILAAWEAMSAGKSLFFSFFGCLRNWRSFLVYGLAVTFVAMMLSVIVLVAAVVSGGHPAAMRGLLLAATLMLMPTLFASFYVAYRDIFPEAAPPVAEP